MIFIFFVKTSKSTISSCVSLFPSEKFLPRALKRVFFYQAVYVLRIPLFSLITTTNYFISDAIPLEIRYFSPLPTKVLRQQSYNPFESDLQLASISVRLKQNAVYFAVQESK